MDKDQRVGMRCRNFIEGMSVAGIALGLGALTAAKRRGTGADIAGRTETTNLADRYSELVEKLWAQWRAWSNDVDVNGNKSKNPKN